MGINRGTVLDLINDVHRAGGFKDYNSYSYLFNQVDTMPESVEKPEPHWIPVTERLPEEEGEYLVTSVYQYYRDGRKTYKTTVDRWSRNGAGKEWVATSNDAHIAWMPLPEPYKSTVPPECEGDCGWCKPSVIEKCKGVTT